MGNPDEYYYIDEDGNLIEPGSQSLEDLFGPNGEIPLDPAQGSEAPFDERGELPVAPPLTEPPAAVDENFLREALGDPPAQAPAPPASTPPPSDPSSFPDWRH